MLDGTQPIVATYLSSLLPTTQQFVSESDFFAGLTHFLGSMIIFRNVLIIQTREARISRQPATKNDELAPNSFE